MSFIRLCSVSMEATWAAASRKAMPWASMRALTTSKAPESGPAFIFGAKWSRKRSIVRSLRRSARTPVKTPPAIDSTITAPAYAMIVKPQTTSTIETTRAPFEAGTVSSPASVTVTTAR